MGAFVDSWQSGTLLDRTELIPVLRSFTLAVLQSAVVAAGFTPEAATRLARYGTISGDTYKRPALRSEGLWLYYKQFKPSSSLFDRILITIDPPLGGDWCLAIRVNTELVGERYRIKNVIAGLQRWGATPTGIDERIVARAAELATAAGIDLSTSPTPEDDGRRWGAYVRLSNWQADEDALVASLGRLLAVLLPVLHERRTWLDLVPRRFVSARFSSSRPMAEVRGQVPHGGGWELELGQRDARQLVSHGRVITASVGEAIVHLHLTRDGNSYCNFSSCTGAFSTIGELGVALGLRRDDRVWLVQRDDGSFAIERAPMPTMLVPPDAILSTEDDGNRLELGLPPSFVVRMRQWENGFARGEEHELFLTDGERVTHRATVFSWTETETLTLNTSGLEPYEMPLDQLRVADTWDHLRGPKGLVAVYDRSLEPVALHPGKPVSTSQQKGDLQSILSAFAAEPSLVYAEADLINLHTALTALPQKHFVILHGPSGTGKSQFAQAYANALHGRALRAPNNPYYKVIPVQPTWQDRGPLLGYFNPLTGRYEVPDFLAHLLKAKDDLTNPYILCLDEMNLAVAEHYFADFLSAWESREPITLHRQGDGLDLPEQVTIPPNLYVIGTVNIDETTHSFSPKVLDRAFPVELAGQDLSIVIDRLIEGHGEVAPALRPIGNLLRDLQSILDPEGLGFAYRTAEESLAFLAQLARAGWPLGQAEAIDRIIHQKILPKLRGDDRRVRALASLEDRIKRALQEVGGDPEQSRSRRALIRMRESAERYGTFQFWG